jgi:uncharacterized protein (DUF362 family)
MPLVCIEKIHEHMTAAVDRLLACAGLPDSLSGQSILLKPNLFEPLPHTTGQTTSPHLVEAVIQCCRRRGARAVTVGEGPSYFTADRALKECFTKTGMAEICERCGVPWVMFDEHPYRLFKDASPDLPAAFRISEHAFRHDIVINLPVPKTHYLTTVSIAMKNLKGFVKREDKPLFHRVGLDSAVVALNTIIRPFMNLVDFTAQAGQPASFALAGRDVVAVDSVSAALMGLSPDEVKTVRLGCRAGLGEMRLEEMEIQGEDIKGLKMHYELPAQWLGRTFPNLTLSGQDTACSGCIIPLFSALRRLADENRVFTHPLTISLGTAPAARSSGAVLAIGQCPAHDIETGYGVGGCPPSRDEIEKALLTHASFPNT